MYEVLTVFPKEIQKKDGSGSFTVYNLKLKKDGKEIPYVSYNKEVKIGDMVDGNLVESGRNEEKGQIYYRLVKKEPITREMVYTACYVVNQGKDLEVIEKETDKYLGMINKI